VIVDRRIKSMKDELAQLVAAEKFEEAAKLRDEIKNLEQGRSQQTGA
jgi:protein-arginine kinase activator protein McsA